LIKNFYRNRKLQRSRIKFIFLQKIIW